MYFNEINILDYYSVECACVGVYQLLTFRQSGCILYPDWI